MTSKDIQRLDELYYSRHRYSDDEINEFIDAWPQISARLKAADALAEASKALRKYGAHSPWSDDATWQKADDVREKWADALANYQQAVEKAEIE